MLASQMNPRRKIFTQGKFISVADIQQGAIGHRGRPNCYLPDLGLYGFAVPDVRDVVYVYGSKGYERYMPISDAIASNSILFLTK